MAFATAKALVQARLGVKVVRAAAGIIDGTTHTLFNVVGGRILLTHLQMVNSAAALDAGANNTNFSTAPTAGAAMNLCANLDTVAAAIGAVFSITGLITDAMTGPVAGGGAMAMKQPVIVPVGTINITSAASKLVGGALQTVTVWYLPLDDGAYVTATTV